MTDNFNGDTPHLILCIEALLELNAAGSLVPHGIPGHAVTMLEAAAVRLAQHTPAGVSGSGKQSFEQPGTDAQKDEKNGVY